MLKKAKTIWKMVKVLALLGVIVWLFTLSQNTATVASLKASIAALGHTGLTFAVFGALLAAVFNQKGLLTTSIIAILICGGLASLA